MFFRTLNGFGCSLLSFCEVLDYTVWKYPQGKPDSTISTLLNSQSAIFILSTTQSNAGSPSSDYTFSLHTGVTQERQIFPSCPSHLSPHCQRCLPAEAIGCPSDPKFLVSPAFLQLVEMVIMSTGEDLESLRRSAYGHAWEGLSGLG